MAYRKEKDYSLGHAVAGIVDMKTALNPNINKTQYKYYYTILPSDHDEKDYDIIKMHEYFKNKEPSLKNKYTKKPISPNTAITIGIKLILL